MNWVKTGLHRKRAAISLKLTSVTTRVEMAEPYKRSSSETDIADIKFIFFYIVKGRKEKMVDDVRNRVFYPTVTIILVIG